ncbi:putative Zinc finger, RING/FYVE/PHD-type [Lupinus albus]|uniref:Putative Zinc finger, RING/FYVE/PHD-type n=1 Tax=Lupinus albus TaxID=3870 RepID=A0A6A4PSR5_LUPAL|nr:putative Zinc finger, RING/FYVE/PHD-type [Lupinus albus]
MPKERRDSSLAHDSRASPYPSSSSCARRYAPKNPLESEENAKEWEEARCPVCMEHPHNAVLLICSSHEKGCRPYMCNTSYRHSNCLDQFRKSFAAETLPTTPQVESEISNTNLSHAQATEINTIDDMQEDRSERSVTTHSLSCEDEAKPKVVCPLCRGQVKEWKVVEAARCFMNKKSRSCSCETCNFIGTYMDLRMHARLEHPLARPFEVDPERQHNWRRLERQRDLADLFSTFQTTFGENRVDDGLLPIDDGGLLAVFFLILQPTTSVSRSTRGTRLMQIRRRSNRLLGEAYEGQSGYSSRDDENESSDEDSDPLRHRVRRQITPDNEQ